MANIRLTHRALSDLQDIYDFSINEWGKNTAEKYLEGIQGIFELLKDNPDILINKPQISNRYKAYQIKSHWLICDILGDDIYILTIKHISMNLLERLNELEPTLEEEVKTLYSNLEKRSK
jgi:toxin ParE1/3/4